MDLEIGYEGIIPLDVTRLTRIGVPTEVARHSDWDQIGKSFTAVRGIGYVVWYPVATEAANLSEGNSVFETVARWKAREVQASLKIKLSHSGEGTPSILLCNGEAGGLRTYEQMGKAYQSVTECTFQPLAEAVPLFVIGNYDSIDRPSMNISYIPDHKTEADNYALAAQLAASFVTEWFGTPKGRSEAKAEVVELKDPGAAPYESGSLLLTPLNNDSKLAQLTAVHQLTHSAFYSPRPVGLRRAGAFCPGSLSRAGERARRGARFHGTASHGDRGGRNSVGGTTNPGRYHKRGVDQHQHRRALPQQSYVRVVDVA